MMKLRSGQPSGTTARPICQINAAHDKPPNTCAVPIALAPELRAYIAVRECPAQSIGWVS
jgi:hypothetical protein